MGIFSKLYIKTKEWAAHKKAPKYLAMLSFAESSFFPIPPDVMLGPMCIAKPRLSYSFASIAVVFSVLGGIFGYLIGYLAFEGFVEPLLVYFNYAEKYITALDWFNRWGFWAITIAGFTPIPYKLFTISAGVMQYNMLLFILSSILGRGIRFLLLSSLIKFGGDKFERVLRNSVDVIGWIVIFAVVVFITIKFV